VRGRVPLWMHAYCFSASTAMLRVTSSLTLRHVLAGVELGALDPGAGIGAERVLLDDRVGHGLEGTEAQGDRPGDALDGEQAFDGHRLVAVKLDGGGLVGDGRVLRGIEEVFALEVLVEQRITGIDRAGVDDDVDRAGLRGAVEDDGAGSLVEALNLVRVPRNGCIRSAGRCGWGRPGRFPGRRTPGRRTGWRG
jgi:hypothetical protein